MNAVSRNAILVAVVTVLGLVIAAIVILFALGKQLPQTAETIGVLTALVGPTLAILLTLLRTEQIGSALNGHLTQHTAEAAQQAAREAVAAAAQAQEAAAQAQQASPPAPPAQ